MLHNAYLLPKIGADTAENEQHFAENVGKIGRRVAACCGLMCCGPRRPPPGPPRPRPPPSSPTQHGGLGLNGQNFANFCRARSRLYQNEILQENMRLRAFFKLYKICIFLRRCNLKILAKNRFEKSAIFVKIVQIADCSNRILLKC